MDKKKKFLIIKIILLKALILGCGFLLSFYPNLYRGILQIKHFHHYDSLIQPNDPEISRLALSLEQELSADHTELDLILKVEKFVQKKNPLSL